MNKLDAQLIAQILGSQNTADVGGNGIQRYYTDPATGQQWYGSVQNYGFNGTGDGQTVDRSRVDPAAWIGRDIPDPDGGNHPWAETYDLSGNYLGRASYDTSWKDMIQAMALMAPAVGGIVGAAGSAAGGGGAAAGAAGGAGAGAGTMANGAFLGEGMASGIGAWDAAAVNSALGSGSLGTAGSYLSQNAANGTLGSTLGNMVGGGSAASNAAQAGAKAAGSGLNAGSLLGAIAGAADGGDKQQTSSRDPWAPAQPFLKQQLDQGQALATQYQQQPFSASQQTAYGNLGGLLDTINKNAGGLLGGFNANATGANNYDRSNPRRQLTGGMGLGQMDLSSYMPGLLGNFGTRKG